MPELRTLKCDCEGCGKTLIEVKPGAGFPGWGGLLGREKDGAEPRLCPADMDAIIRLLKTGLLVKFRDDDAVAKVAAFLNHPLPAVKELKTEN